MDVVTVMAMELPVKAGELTLFTVVDDEDAARIGGRRLSLSAGRYVQFWQPDGNGNGAPVLLHRWIMGAVPHDGRIVDHDNRNTLDNQQHNLKFVTAGESSANITGHAGSGYRGVYPNHARWMARGKRGGKSVYLGTFDTPEEAAQVAHDWRVENLPNYRDPVPPRHDVKTR